MVNIYNANGREMVENIKKQEDLAKRELSDLVNLMVDGLKEIAQHQGNYLLHLIDSPATCYREYKINEGFVDTSDTWWYYSLTSKGDIWCMWQKDAGSRHDSYIIEGDVYGFLDSLITSSDTAEKYIEKVIRSVEELNDENNLEIELPKIFSSYKENKPKVKAEV